MAGLLNSGRGMALGVGLLSGGNFRNALARGGQAMMSYDEQQRQAALQNERMGLLRGQDARAAEKHGALLSQWKDASEATKAQAEASQRLRAAAILNGGQLTPEQYAQNAGASFDLGTMQGLSPKPIKAESTIGKIQSDLNNGLITPQQAQARAAKLNHITPGLFNPDGTLNQPYFDAQKQLRIAGRNNVSVGINNVDTVKNSRDAYKDYRNDDQTKNYNKLRAAYGRLKTSLSRESGIGDTAAIVEINKMLDPNSVVREAEFAIAMESSGKLDKLRNYGNSLIKGHKLSAKQRNEYFALASEFMRGVEQTQQQFHASTRSRAESFGMDSSRIAPDLPTIDYSSPFKNQQDSIDNYTDEQLMQMSDEEFNRVTGGN